MYDKTRIACTRPQHNTNMQQNILSPKSTTSEERIHIMDHQLNLTIKQQIYILQRYDILEPYLDKNL